jgi:hypothetical protein
VYRPTVYLPALATFTPFGTIVTPKTANSKQKLGAKRTRRMAKKTANFDISSVFLPIHTDKITHFDEILQKHLDFFEIGYSTILSIRVSCMPSLRMHRDGGPGQEAPPVTHLIVVLQSIDP